MLGCSVNSCLSFCQLCWRWRRTIHLYFSLSRVTSAAALHPYSSLSDLPLAYIVCACFDCLPHIPSAFDVPMQHFSCNLIAPSLLTCPNHLNLPPWISSHRSTISVLCCCCWVIVNRQRKHLAQRCVHLSRGQLTTPEYVAPESRDWMWWRMACRKTPRNSLRRRLELCSGLGERYYFHAPKSN